MHPDAQDSCVYRANPYNGKQGNDDGDVPGLCVGRVGGAIVYQATWASIVLYEQPRTTRSKCHMTEESHLTIDPNTADAETLTQLPGVGLTMAQRIVAARPFTSIEDLRRVGGIGPALLERWRPALELSEAVAPEEETPAAPAPLETASEPPEETAPQPEVAVQPGAAAPPLEAGAPAKAEAAPLELELPPEPEAPPAELEMPVAAAEAQPPPAAVAPPPKAPAGVSRGQALWMAFGVGVLACILALALSLGILANINDGNLQFVSLEELSDLRREVDGLSTQIETLDQDVAGLRTRLGNLEALSGRVSAVSEAVEQMQSDVDAATTQVAKLKQQMEGLDTQVEALQTQGARLEGFLEGLRDLLDHLFAAEESK